MSSGVEPGSRAFSTRYALKAEPERKRVLAAYSFSRTQKSRPVSVSLLVRAEMVQVRRPARTGG